MYTSSFLLRAVFFPFFRLAGLHGVLWVLRVHFFRFPSGVRRGCCSKCFHAHFGRGWVRMFVPQGPALS